MMKAKRNKKRSIILKKEKISDEDLIDMDQSNENITDASIAPPAYLINEKKSKTSGHYKK